MIKEDSPKFFGILRRLFTDSQIPDFELAFDLAREHGGFEEEDFTRDPESSYNPRPARIGQIVIEDCKQTEPSIVLASILSCAKETAGMQAASTQFSESVVEIVNNIAAHLSLDAVPYPKEKSPDGRAIVAAHVLDRLRHLHLAPVERQSLIEASLMHRAEAIISDCESELSFIAKRIDAAANLRNRTRKK